MVFHRKRMFMAAKRAQTPRSLLWTKNSFRALITEFTMSFSSFNPNSFKHFMWQCLAYSLKMFFCVWRESQFGWIVLSDVMSMRFYEITAFEYNYMAKMQPLTISSEIYTNTHTKDHFRFIWNLNDLFCVCQAQLFRVITGNFNV